MKEWFNQNKKLFSHWKFKVALFVFLAVLVIGLIIGPVFYGYTAAVAIFVGFYLFAKQAEGERMISPKELQAMQEDIKALEQEADIIREHIESHHEDLEAKLLLRSIEEEIQVLRDAMPKNR